MPQAVETSNQSMFGAWIEVRLGALKQNLQALRDLQLPGTQVLAVVKASAYGHGLVPVARALAPHVDYLGVSSIREVIELKEHVPGARIFLFARLLPHEVPGAVLDGVTLMVSSVEEAEMISAESVTRGTRTIIHAKVDTGMGRLGIPFGRAVSSIEKIVELPGVQLEGIFTHFPTAEAEDGFMEKQAADFTLLLQALEKKGLLPALRHAANSAASVRLKHPLLNMIRPGLMLYGLYPDESLKEKISLEPALSLKSRLISVKRLAEGQTVGYGRRFTAPRPTSIGLLPLGYSHGYPVRASQEGKAIYQGRLVPLAGRVSMDYMAVDLGDMHARPGDVVTLIGREGDAVIRAEDVAAWAGTIPYEIVTGFASTLPRRYEE